MFGRKYSRTCLPIVILINYAVLFYPEDKKQHFMRLVISGVKNTLILQDLIMHWQMLACTRLIQ